MKVQRILTGLNQYNYLLLDDNYQVVEPVHEYFKVLTGQASPNSLKLYCFHLKYYFEFLREINTAYNEIGSPKKSAVEILTKFKGFLRRKPIDDTDTGQLEKKVRSWVTVNSIITTVVGFYDFLAFTGEMKEPDVYKYHRSIPRYRRFLSEIQNNHGSTRKNVLLVKTPKLKPEYITRKEYEIVKDKCKFIRDKLILALMFEGGLRLGEVLGCQLEDFEVWNNKILIISRENLENGARVKCQADGEMFLPPYVMQLYISYLKEERGLYESTFVFVNLHGADIGKPMKHSTVQKKFRQLSKETGIRVHPHMCRHGFATECYKDGMDWRQLQKAMRHRHIETTIDIYTHFESEMLQEELQAHHLKRGVSDENN